MKGETVAQIRMNMPCPARREGWKGAPIQHPSQVEFAALVGCSAKAVRNWEQGRSCPSPEMEARIRRAVPRDLLERVLAVMEGQQ